VTSEPGNIIDFTPPMPSEALPGLLAQPPSQPLSQALLKSRIKHSLRICGICSRSPSPQRLPALNDERFWTSSIIDQRNKYESRLTNTDLPHAPAHYRHLQADARRFSVLDVSKLAQPSRTRCRSQQHNRTLQLPRTMRSHPVLAHTLPRLDPLSASRGLQGFLSDLYLQAL
jgi:hypothetical protein